jgi:Uri superfamily endonuclease
MKEVTQKEDEKKLRRSCAIQKQMERFGCQDNPHKVHMSRKKKQQDCQQTCRQYNLKQL